MKPCTKIQIDAFFFSMKQTNVETYLIFRNLNMKIEIFFLSRGGVDFQLDCPYYRMH